MCTGSARTAHHSEMQVQGAGWVAHVRPSFPVEFVKVLVLEGLRQLHNPVCPEVENHHCIPILHCHTHEVSLRCLHKGRLCPVWTYSPGRRIAASPMASVLRSCICADIIHDAWASACHGAVVLSLLQWSYQAWLHVSPATSTGVKGGGSLREQSSTCIEPTGWSFSSMMTKAGTHWSDTGLPFFGFCTAKHGITSIRGLAIAFAHCTDGAKTIQRQIEEAGGAARRCSGWEKVYLEDFQGFHRVCKLVVCLAQDMCMIAALHHIPVRLQTTKTPHQLLQLAGRARLVPTNSRSSIALCA